MSTTSASGPPRRNMFVDRELRAANGYLMIAIGLAVIAVCAWLVYLSYDKDGNAPDTKISEEQVGEIRSMMLCIRDGEARLLKYMKVETVEEIPARQYRKAISALDEQIAKEKANVAS